MTSTSHLFEARLTQSLTLKRVMEAVKDLVKEGNFDCNEEGFSLHAMDNTQVALADVLLRAQAFEMYSCETPMTLGISLDHVSKVLKCSANDDAVTLKASSETPDHAEFMFESAKSDRISCFEVKLMDIDAEHIYIPDIQYTASIKMPSSEYKRIVTDLSQIGDMITIEIGKAGASFSVSGDIGKGNVCLHPTVAVDKKDKPDQEIAISYEDPISLAFSLEFMSMFAKACSLSSTVELQLTNHSPMAVNFTMDDEAGYLCYYLAPRIEEEEESGEMEDEEEPVPRAKKAKTEPVAAKSEPKVKNEPETKASGNMSDDDEEVDDE
eukprot:CAMPEP_0182445690 /NCGR_PEP_ID=MMETSP1172-20130603/3729_1 /TAXON_ID=708627 /ORGANISM="Timspurckia oligopyrenoides, Strain CCMP3278" /LENGTH=323 /DNA_ID=CAMNT_0024641503 /DNA_START=60 /DNA_END=1031 /DNA_ORIENTATION=+